jgi:hypothetical protein
MFDPGSVAVHLARAGSGRVQPTVQLVRPDIASLFHGHPADEAVRKLPLLYSVCGKAQSLAARLALRAARGESVTVACDPEVLVEARRERLMRLALDWPRALGLPVREDLLVAGVRLLAQGDFPDWMTERFSPHVEALRAVGAPANILPVFADDLGTAHAEPTGAHAGRAEVVTARGALVHEIELDGDAIATYRLIAPTDRHFSAEGAVAEALGALTANSEEDLRRAAEVVVLHFDPCVRYEITLSA